MKKIFYAILISISFLNQELFCQDKVLDINPVYQETPAWCWVAVGEMIFKYNEICCINPAGDYQCGIIALLGPVCNVNCYNCIVPSGTAQVIQNMLREYPRFARQYCGSGKYSISSILNNSRLSRESVVKEIDSDRPILAGISPKGGFGGEPEHAVLIIGYEIDENDQTDEMNMYLIVNDPFPYEYFVNRGVVDPYISAGGEFITSGQYRILYSDFLKLRWTHTLKNIR